MSKTLSALVVSLSLFIWIYISSCIRNAYSLDLFLLNSLDSLTLIDLAAS
jgi:hypothetical protein